VVLSVAGAIVVAGTVATEMVAWVGLGYRGGYWVSMIDSRSEKGLNCSVLVTLLARRMRGSSCERSRLGVGVGACKGVVAAIADLGSLLGALVALFCRAILIYIMGN
jgi:hypothetical protein